MSLSTDPGERYNYYAATCLTVGRGTGLLSTPGRDIDLPERPIWVQIGFMPNRKLHPKPTPHKRVKPTPSVELQYSKHTFDVNTWLSEYAERAVDREVHLLADRAPEPESSSPPASHRAPGDTADTTQTAD